MTRLCNEMYFLYNTGKLSYNIKDKLHNFTRGCRHEILSHMNMQRMLTAEAKEETFLA